MTEFINGFFPLPGWSIWVIRALSGLIVSSLGFMGVSYFIAARKFHETIRNELEGLYPTPVNWPKDSSAIYHILEEKYPRLENAVHQFKGHLPCFLLRGIDKAWLQYHKDYYQYMPFSGSSIVNGKEIRHDNTKTYKETFKKNVDALLKYAKQI